MAQAPTAATDITAAQVQAFLKDAPRDRNMLEGAGVLVTGGTLRKPTAPRQSTLGNWTDVGGDGIDGGLSRRISKGDVVIIPGGVPHGWASLEGNISYLIVRSDPSKKVPLK